MAQGRNKGPEAIVEVNPVVAQVTAEIRAEMAQERRSERAAERVRQMAEASKVWIRQNVGWAPSEKLELEDLGIGKTLDKYINPRTLPGYDQVQKLSQDDPRIYSEPWHHADNFSPEYRAKIRGRKLNGAAEQYQLLAHQARAHVLFYLAWLRRCNEILEFFDQDMKEPAKLPKWVEHALATRELEKLKAEKASELTPEQKAALEKGIMGPIKRDPGVPTSTTTVITPPPEEGPMSDTLYASGREKLDILRREQREQWLKDLAEKVEAGDA